MTTTNTQVSIKDAITQRHAYRYYEKNKPIPDETLKELLSLASRAPSSWNLQHWKYLVVQKQENKDKLVPIAYGQQQVADCSALVIVLGDKEANLNAEKVYGPAVGSGQMPEEAKNNLIKQINDAYANVPNIGVHEAIKNASLGAMTLMLAAEGLGLKTGPMGGFDAAALRKKLNIPDRYIPIMMITVGYPVKEARPSTRFDIDEILVEESF